MTRVLSGADMIGKNARPNNQHRVPREGTHIRAVYDLFMENRGKPVRVRFTNKFGHPDDHRVLTTNSTVKSQLTDIYGLEILRVVKNTWVLIGEWRDGFYIDYSNGRYQP